MSRLKMTELTDLECERLTDIQNSSHKLSPDEIGGLDLALAAGMKLETYLTKVFQERMKLVPEPEPEPEPQN